MSAGATPVAIGDDAGREKLLRAVAAAGDRPVALAEAALALATAERPRVDPGRYLDHLAILAR
ncbi:MAG: hypothetical protein JO010_12775, partial [Alphaproteobacteria bacterium]|nr:hypothetical protein [Alphaproteobacteria bacterium]